VPGSQRRVRFESGRVVVTGPPLPGAVPVPPAGRGVIASQAPAHSQAALHGSGIGLGLALITAGASGGQQGGGAPAAAPTYVDSVATARPGANVGSLNVTMPTYVAGDHVLVLLCGDFLLNGDTASAAGWTQDGRQANGNQIAFAFHRLMTGGEGAAVTFTFNNAFERPFAIAASYRGASGLEASVIQGQNTPVNTWSLPNLVVTGASRKLVTLIYSASGNAGTDFTTVDGGATKRIDVTNNTSPNGVAAAAMIADLAAPAAGSYTMSGAISSFTLWLGVLVGLKP